MNLKIKRTISGKTSPQEIVAHLLKDRNIEDAKTFLNPPHPKSIPFKSFFKNEKKFDKQIEKTVKLLTSIKKQYKTIVVYTDYDADGITGGAILWETLHLLGFNVMPYVPDRKTEGYGFSKKGIDAVKKKYDPALVISVDHGIVAHEKISYAKENGIPIIVTDHHQKLETEPKDAFAIFHTDKISGAGVAYFFARELYAHFKKDSKNKKILTENFETDYLALASIGIIADLVPLVGEARAVVFHGLKAFPKVSRVGLRHLLKEAQIEGREVTPYEVGFIISPRINAFGRLHHAIDALRLLCTVSEERAVDLAKLAGKTNKLRQDLVGNAIEDATKKVDTKNKIIILSSDKWEEGIIGLIASKMVQEFYRPTIVMTKSDGYYKASARSIGGFDITKFLRSLKKFLVDVGGHSAAAGFIIEVKQVVGFKKEAIGMANKIIKDKDLVPSLSVDLSIPLSLVSLNLASQLEKLQPFGVGNPKPLFYSEAELLDARLIGKTQDHLKIVIGQQEAFPLEIVFFGEGSKFTSLSQGQKLSVVYSLTIDRWNGKETVKGMGREFI